MLITDRLNTQAFPLLSKQQVQLVVGKSPGNTAIHVPVWLLVGHQREPEVVFTAGVHGDEFEGMRALMKLAHALAPEALYGTLIMAPVVNPPAYEARSRFSPVDGINLNRVFPGHPQGSPSERLAYALMENLILGADLLVDLHSGGTTLLHLPVAGFYTMEGSGERSRAAAQATGMPYLWHLPHRAGVLSYEAARAGVAAVGTEVGGAACCAPHGVALTYDALLGVLRFMEVLRDASPKGSTPRVVSGDWLVANASGFFEPSVTLNQAVEKNDLLGRILDPFGYVTDDVLAPQAGIVLGMRTFPTVAAGQLVIFAPSEGNTATAGVSSV